MADRSKFQVVVTPAGEAVFPWLNEPDTRYKQEGEYHVNLSIPEKQAQPLVERLEGILNTFISSELTAAQRRALVPQKVFSEEYTRPPKDASDKVKAEWEGEPTGNLLFKFKMKAIVTPKNKPPFEQKPVIVFAEDGSAVEEPVYSGSTIRIKGQVVPYVNAAAGAVGVSLRLKSVQVIDLVTGSGDAYWTDFDSDE